MNLEHFIVPQNKEIKKKEMGMLKGHRSQPEGVPHDQGWNSLNKSLTDSLDDNSNNKINIHELY